MSEKETMRCLKCKHYQRLRRYGHRWLCSAGHPVPRYPVEDFALYCKDFLELERFMEAPK